MAEQLESSKGKATWSVVVIYDDPEARESAVCFCDLLVERFWSRCGFEVNWWSFELLQEAESARQAGEKASEANYLVFASRQEALLPKHLMNWVDSWVEKRAEREGALIGLLGQDPDTNALKESYLRRLAHRLGLDYLTQPPSELSDPVPDSLDSYNARAAQVSSVLDEILHYHPPPPKILNQ